MSRKKVRIIIGISLGIAFAALVALIIVVIKNNRKEPGRESTPTGVPNGSVVVWRWTETHIKEEGEPEYTSAKQEFDEFGRCVKRMEYSAENGALSAEYLYQYDDTAYRTTEIRREYNVEGNLSYQETKVYDSAGRVLRNVDDYGGGDIRSSESVYNEDGVCVERYEYAGEPVPENMTSRYAYDAYGHPAKYEQRTEEGTWEALGISAKDASGRVISYDEWSNSIGAFDLSVRYDFHSDGSYTRTEETPYGTIIREYDAGGYIVSYDKYSESDEGEPEYSGYEYTYTEDADGITVKQYRKSSPEDTLSTLFLWEKFDTERGLRQRWYVDESGKSYSLIDSEFDASGRMIKSTRNDYLTEEYSYDEYGNCIEEKTTYQTDPEAWDYKDQVITYTYKSIVVTMEQKELAEKFYLPYTTYELDGISLEFCYQELFE